MKILIVGGGTAGWMTAGYLAKYRGGENITLVESATIPKIGVGESVTPHVCNFFKEIGIDEFDWMKVTGAVHKYANKFVNWQGNGDEQYFSFNYTVPTKNFYKDIPVNKTQEDFTSVVDAPRSIDTVSELCQSKIFNRFDKYFNPQFHYMEQNVMPYKDGQDLLNQPFSHAHHINAELAGPYIKDKIAIPAGVKHVVNDVVKVNVEGDCITSVLLGDGTELTADLYIDCSGFARVLSNALGWKLVEKNTPIDRAWVCQTEYVDPEAEMVNYTQSIAEPYGWRFKIGVYHRMGNGYCFSSKHTTEEEALDHFIKQIGPQRRPPRLIKWTPTRLEKFGDGNCAAIGLSCGFTEPLEANALYTIITSIRRLNNVLDESTLDFSTYNEKMAYTIDDISDFILVHYTLSNRSDTKFWTDMQELGKKLKHRELVVKKIYEEKNTMKSAVEGYTMFPDYMWAQLAVTWGIPFDTKPTSNIEKELSKQYFEYSDRKHKLVSSVCKNNYQWHKENIFDNMPNTEWEEKWISK
jgi:tryptophan 7-halogenase